MKQRTQREGQVKRERATATAASSREGRERGRAGGETDHCAPCLNSTVSKNPRSPPQSGQRSQRNTPSRPSCKVSEPNPHQSHTSYSYTQKLNTLCARPTARHFEPAGLFARARPPNGSLPSKPSSIEALTRTLCNHFRISFSRRYCHSTSHSPWATSVLYRAESQPNFATTASVPPRWTRRFCDSQNQAS